jgi:hypothetical protein
MLYVVEIRRERGELAKMMSGIREWLDRQHFEPDAFRCGTAVIPLFSRIGNNAAAGKRRFFAATAPGRAMLQPARDRTGGPVNAA